ncbi:MAG: hypothetical protein KA536_15085 [Saprospiraceae bacterium]|jgi:hypothetical protein|nr:hypothetical protein [Saprospiraceae bacterium]
MNILIVDDIDITTIEEIILQAGSVLNKRCTIKSYQFAMIIPNVNEFKRISVDEIAINGIKTDEQYDIAFLDLEFTKEDYELKENYRPIINLVEAVSKNHPYCEIIIVSNDQGARGVHWDYKPKALNEHFVSIPKDPDKLTTSEFNEAIIKVLEKRFKHLILNCNTHQLEAIQKYLAEKIQTFEFSIDKYKVTPERLFFHFFDSNCKLDTDSIQEKWLELIYDVPKFKDEYWLCSKPITPEQKVNILGIKPNDKDKLSSEIRKYPLKDYYNEYYRFFVNERKLGLNTLIENAEYAVKNVINYLSGEMSAEDLRDTFLGYPATKYTSLKFNMPKFNNRIPDEDMFKFSDFLTHRLLHFGLYFGANMSAPGINLLVDKNSYCTDPTGKFSVYLGIEKHVDQLHTETDSLIEKNDILENVLRNQSFKDGEQKDPRANKLSLLNEYNRKYQLLYGNLAKYEKDFIKNICNYAFDKNLPRDAKEHIEHIVTKLPKWG